MVVMEENARQVARDVIKTVSAGKKLKKMEIAIKNGYSKSSAKAMRPYRTKAYKEETQSFLDIIVKERDRIAKAMSERKLSTVRYEGLSDVFDKLNKNIQLLTGKPTDIKAINLDDTQKEELKKLFE